MPLFPLYTVLFPGGPLPLRVFEQRYLEMISDCLKKDSAFGVCLIEHGREVGEAASTVNMGVTAKIIDWEKRDDGLLGITVMGQQRFEIESVDVMPSQLTVASVKLVDTDEQVAVPDMYRYMSSLVKQLLTHAGSIYQNIEKKYTSAEWVSCRLSELLPIDLMDKQALLEMNSSMERLEEIHKMLDGMDVI